MATTTQKRPVKKAPAKKRVAAKKAAARRRAGGRPPYKRPDPSRRWRPRGPKDRRGPVCGYTLDGKRCRKKGAHYCEPRADRFVAFCREILLHTAGPKARHPFILEDWQEWEIARPLFGEVVWDVELERYVRRYRVAYIVIARKNGKSELAAAIVLYLLLGDDEDAAQVYGAAKDTKQAGKVYEPVKRMMQLSPVLRRRLKENKAARRIYDESSGSYYEVITADALGELGHNPHGFVLDEVLSQPDRTLWDAMRTALGARSQALMVAITTETNQPVSFGADLIDEAERVQEDPARAPHIFAWVRKTAADKDPFAEANWYRANPALGRFKSLKAMREMAIEAKNDPAALEAFLQLQLNIRRSAQSRWMQMPVWDAAAGMVVEADLVGRTCFAGLDLASTTDLAAWVLRFPATDDLPAAVLWRFWAPEAQLKRLDEVTGGKASVWVRQGLLVATDGDWIDYTGDDRGRSGTGLAIQPQIRADFGLYRIARVGYDPWEATGTAQFMQQLWGDDSDAVQPVAQGYKLSEALKEMMRQAKAGTLGHGGHPVARWCADGAEVKRDDQDRIKLVRPDRAKAKTRVDGIAALAVAMHVELDWAEQQAADDFDFLVV